MARHLANHSTSATYVAGEPCLYKGIVYLAQTLAEKEALGGTGAVDYSNLPDANTKDWISTDSSPFAPLYSDLSQSEIDALIPGVSRVRAADGRVKVLSIDSRRVEGPDGTGYTPAVVTSVATRTALTSGMTDAEKLDHHGSLSRINNTRYSYNSITDAWAPTVSTPGNPNTSPDSYSTSWDVEVPKGLPDLADYGFSETDGVLNAERFNRCIAENLSFTITDPGFVVPISDNIVIRKFGHIYGGFTTFLMEGDTNFGWNGINKTESLTDWSVSSIKFNGDASRSDDAAIVRIESAEAFNGVPNTAPPGKDCARFSLDDVKILGASKSGLGIELLGLYTGRVGGLRVSQCAQGYLINRGTQTSYGCNGVHFIHYEIQGCLKIGYVEDFYNCSFRGIEQGADTGVTIQGPGRGLDLNIYHELIGQSLDPALRYSYHISRDASGAAPENVVIAPTSVFLAPAKTGPTPIENAIFVKGAIGLEIHGNYYNYTGSPVKNISTAVDEIIGFVGNLVGDYKNPWSANESPPIDVETARFYSKNHVHRQNVTEVAAGTVDTILASYTLPSLGFHLRAEPVVMRLNGRLNGIDGANRILKVRINGVDIAGMNWQSTAANIPFMLEVHAHGVSNTEQFIFAKCENYIGASPVVRRSKTTLNTLTNSMTIEIVGRCATANGLIKEVFAYDNGKR